MIAVMFAAFMAGSGVLGYLIGSRDRKRTRMKWHDPRLGRLGASDRLIEQPRRRVLPLPAALSRYESGRYLDAGEQGWQGDR